MSKEAKNEIDLMLRQLGRRDGVAHSDEQHLDADELNSYVANALPSAARARYTEHLADCTSCRRLVAQLSAAQGPVVEQAGSIPAPSGLKQFLTSLLSPMVLRYAVPALGVMVVMIIGFVVLRRGPAERSVAELMQPNEDRSVAVAASPSPQPALEGFHDQQALRQPESPASKPAPVQGESSAAVSAEQPSSAAVTANAPPIATPEVQSFSSSPSPVAPPAPKGATEAEDTQRRADAEKKAAAEPASRAKLDELTVGERGKQSTAAQPQRTGVAAAGPGSTVSRPLEVGRLAKSREAAGAGEGAKRTRSETRAEADDKTTAKAEIAKDKTDAETRSVAGRRFRKSGNVWIDTAYDPSQQTFSMTRGSERFRVLVADVPEIRQIAEQLDGEFIVVWKGRAYRIRSG